LMHGGRTLDPRTRARPLRASATSTEAHMRSARLPDGQPGIIGMSLASRTATLVEDAPGRQPLLFQGSRRRLKHVTAAEVIGSTSNGNGALLSAVSPAHSVAEPWGSRSRAVAVLSVSSVRAVARWMAVVVLVVPPLRLEMAMVGIVWPFGEPCLRVYLVLVCAVWGIRVSGICRAGELVVR